jgi:hypothetical protein
VSRNCERGNGCEVEVVSNEKLVYLTAMTAATALNKQIERYRQMTGEQRLKIALDLHEMSCNIARAGIRRQHPEANETEVENFLHARLKLARAA